MTRTLNYKVLLAAALATLAVIGFALFAHASFQIPGQQSRVVNADSGFSQTYTFFNATTTTATSTNAATSNDPGFFKIAGAKKVVMYFSRGDALGHGNSGSTNFKVQVTPDGTNWYDFKTLVQNAATSTTPTTLASDTISAATSTLIDALDLQYGKMGFYGVRCIAVVTTDGENTCKAYAEF